MRLTNSALLTGAAILITGCADATASPLTCTFGAPGETLAGCHVQGHYIAGMKAVITVE